MCKKVTLNHLVNKAYRPKYFPVNIANTKYKNAMATRAKDTMGAAIFAEVMPMIIRSWAQEDIGTIFNLEKLKKRIAGRHLI